jgi:hypothetical protein
MEHNNSWKKPPTQNVLNFVKFDIVKLNTKRLSNLLKSNIPPTWFRKSFQPDRDKEVTGRRCIVQNTNLTYRNLTLHNLT